MKIAVFGGSFNPFHIGHAMLADSIIHNLNYDKILLVPAYMPPHKANSGLLSPELRLGMLKAFCDSVHNSCFEVEDCEIKREGISYSYETLEYITQKYKGQIEGKPGFVMGDDVAAEFHKWKNPDLICSMADLIITHRYREEKWLDKSSFENTPLNNYEGNQSAKFNPKDFKYPFIVLKEPVIPVSSTEIRARISANLNYRFLLPEAVYNFIEEHKLYR